MRRMWKPKLSLMIHTASRDDFLRNEGIPSAAAMTVDMLDKQDFPKDQFELIFVDRYYDDHPELFQMLRPRFLVKHVPVHPEHRYWMDKGYVFIAAAKNTGILYADGEHLITMDDGSVMNDHQFLSHYWNYAQAGLYLNAGYCRWRNILSHNGLPEYPLQGRQEINDTRNFNGHVFEHTRGNWLFSGSSFPLEHALRINGFNERIDGTKSLEDCDFGIRLQLTGGKFVMDRSVWVHILEHTNDYSKINSIIAVENYGVLRWAEELGETKANVSTLTDKHLEVVQRHTKYYRFFDPLAPENAERLAIWMGVPTFDLAEQRDELRKSSMWRW